MRLQLRLYVVDGDYLSDTALKNVRKLLGDEADIDVVDVARCPQLAREHGVVAIPTLERVRPEPRKRVIGDLSDREALKKFLGCGQ